MTVWLCQAEEPSLNVLWLFVVIFENIKWRLQTMYLFWQYIHRYLLFNKMHKSSVILKVRENKISVVFTELSVTVCLDVSSLVLRSSVSREILKGWENTSTCFMSLWRELAVFYKCSREFLIAPIFISADSVEHEIPIYQLYQSTKSGYSAVRRMAFNDTEIIIPTHERFLATQWKLIAHIRKANTWQSSSPPWVMLSLSM